MTSRGGRVAGWVLAVVAVVVLCVGVVVLVLRAPGDVDPGGILVSGASLLVAIVTGWWAWLALRHADADPSATAARLAGQVLAAEMRARRRLLGGDASAIDVRFVFRPAPAPDAAGARPDGTLREVADYYRRLRPGRLVITGAPGSGKTVLAIELILALLDKRDPGEPVPVRLSLASWAELTSTAQDPMQRRAPDPDHVRAWLVRVLADTYRLRRAAARSLVDAGMVLPVLDGLDEMDAAGAGTTPYRTRARHALETLNAYQHGRDRAPLVLTSRSATYLGLEALNVWTRDAARVEITTVSLLQARAFIIRRASDPQRWQPVLERLSAAPSGALARGLSTPWRLTVAVAAHEQRSSAGVYVNTPRDLLNPALDTEAAVRDYLIRLVVTTTIEAHPPPGGPDPQRVRTWLGTLAAYLNNNAATGRTVAGRALSGTDLVPHELWPIAGPRRAGATHALLLLAAGCLIAAPGVLACIAAGDVDLAVVVSGAAVSGTIGVLAHLWVTPWSPAPRADWSRLRTASGRRRLGPYLAAGLATGLVFGALIGLASGLRFWIVFGVVYGVVYGLMTGLVVGSDRRQRATGNPGEVIGGNLAFGIGIGFFTGLPGAVAAGGRRGETVLALVPGITFGIATGLGIAAVGVRYLALVVCTRRGPVALPLSLRRFLAWAEEAGLLRIAGNAYQFRHRELQDWLADPANQV